MSLVPSTPDESQAIPKLTNLGETQAKCMTLKRNAYIKVPPSVLMMYLQATAAVVSFLCAYS
jgi:hypothetical protein